MSDETLSEPKLEPPDACRVVLRAFCLSAIVCRCNIDDGPEQRNYRWVYERIKPWLESMGAVAELETWEAEAIAQPMGTLDTRTRVNGTWLAEGLVVLAWALRRCEIPPHDIAVDAIKLTNDLLFLREDALDMVASASLRSREIETAASRAFAVHWRIRQYTLTPGAMDFANFAKTAWFGPLNIEGVTLADSDLSINGKPISHASEGEVGFANSIAMERHRAFNWLMGYDEIFSEVDTST